jgi:hypothetical protein
VQHFDALKQDINSSLPMQFQALVQQINGEMQGKHVEGTPTTHNLSSTLGQATTGVLANASQPNSMVNLNL